RLLHRGRPGCERRLTCKQDGRHGRDERERRTHHQTVHFHPPQARFATPSLRRQIEPTAAESGCQTAALKTRLGFRRAKATPDHLEGKSCPAWPFHLRHDPRIKAAS